MDVQVSAVIESVFRWFHVVAGILWIGLLYFFNWVNGPFAATMDGDTKKKVVPQLMPRTLFWFRWGAAWTWVTGVVLLLLVFYHGGALLENPSQGYTMPTFVMLAVVFLGVFVYDILMKTVGKANIKVAVIIGFLLIAGAIYLMGHWAGWSYRGYVIHTGAMFGTIMAFNVWFRIWPSQRKIITAVRDGQAPDAALVATAGLRSKHNTYLSVPLVWMMINLHTTWASIHWLILVGVIAFAWIGVHHLYKKAAKVKGF